jgi:hypothetical protein
MTSLYNAARALQPAARSARDERDDSKPLGSTCCHRNVIAQSPLCTLIAMLQVGRLKTVSNKEIDTFLATLL